jgi:hypothetical protein
VDVHDCFGGTERIAGEQSECSVLFVAGTSYSRPHGNCVQHRSIAGRAPPVRAGQVKEIGVMSCPVRTFPTYLSHSPATVA